MTGEKSMTFRAKDTGVALAEAQRCIREFIPLLRNDLRGDIPMHEIMEQIAERYGPETILDVTSFRVGMYSLAVAQESLRLEEERIAAGMRFIV